MKQEIAVIHLTYNEKAPTGAKQTMIYVGWKGKVQRIALESEKFKSLVTSFPHQTLVRVTQPDPSGALVEILSDLGLNVVGTHWHKTGIESGLPPEEIVAAFSKLPDSLFRPIRFRKDIADLRKAVAIRLALIQFQGDAVRRIKSAARDWRAEDDPEILNAVKGTREIRNQDIALPGDGFIANCDKQVIRYAERVPECKLLAEIAGMESLIAVAQIIAAIGDVSRFEGRVSAVWKYLGNDVVDGHAPKREVGKPCTWSPKGRVALYLLGQCIIKNRNNPWRKMFDDERAAEYEIHDQKCTFEKDSKGHCRTKDGHCTNRAIRKVCKEIIKQFVIAASGQKFVINHKPHKRFPRPEFARKAS